MTHNAPRLPWMEFSTGERIVIRRREADGLYDSIGYVVETTPTHVTLDTRKGKVTIPATKMVTGKRVPEPPQLD